MRERDGVTIATGADPVTVVFRTPDYATEIPEGGWALNLRNSPNPFNPRTTFEFNLPREGRVALRIYNLRGQLVRELGSRTMAAGPTRLEWAGRDGRGSTVASGTYFYRLMLDGEQLGKTRKMSLLK